MCGDYKGDRTGRSTDPPCRLSYTCQKQKNHERQCLRTQGGTRERLPHTVLPKMGQTRTRDNQSITYRLTSRFPSLRLPRNPDPLLETIFTHDEPLHLCLFSFHKVSTSIDITRRISQSQDMTSPLNLLQSESTDNRNTAIILQQGTQHAP